MGLKVIDGTPTAISKYIREQKEKPKKLPEMQATDMKCVFCGKSNQEVEGGFHKGKFICREDQKSFMDDWTYLDLPYKKKGDKCNETLER